MTERSRPDRGSTVGGLHLQISGLLAGCLVGAVVATAALIIAVVVGMSSSPPGPGPNGMPPPPPSMHPAAAFAVVTGLFVLSWVAVAVVFCRDQILQRLEAIEDHPGTEHRQVQELLADLRTELAADRERDLQVLQERLTQYGEERETDGYLSGMRVAADEAKVRSIRRTPPQR
jgi:hypothetical protein